MSGLERTNQGTYCSSLTYDLTFFSFMPADTLWTLCMALNVYFTFFRRYSAADLRRFEKWYLLLCYASTLVPALIYLILDHAADTGIYGPAVVSVDPAFVVGSEIQADRSADLVLGLYEMGVDEGGVLLRSRLVSSHHFTQAPRI